MIEKLLEQVDKERIYKIITDLEGPRHPIDNMKKLNEAKDYIAAYLENIGVTVELHTFYIKGFDEPFYNIIGTIGDPGKPAILLGSHYDSYRFTPGANDNLSAVAVSLETARVLMTLEHPPSVKIAVFTLEEGHPGLLKYRNELFEKHGIINSKGVFQTSEFLAADQMLSKRVRKHRLAGVKKEECYKNILLDTSLPESERQIATLMDRVYREYNPAHLEEAIGLIGSSTYAKKVREENIQIDSAIVFDCLGWIKKGEFTQKKVPLSPEMEPLIKTHRVDLEKTTGDFIAIFGDKNSRAVVQRFAGICSNSIDIPNFSLELPLDHAQIKEAAPDVLRSDHASFWEINIPAVFITDSANFRSDYYHTPADQSQFIDYNMLAKITRATLLYVLG